ICMPPAAPGTSTPSRHPPASRYGPTTSAHRSPADQRPAWPSAAACWSSRQARRSPRSATPTRPSPGPSEPASPIEDHLLASPECCATPLFRRIFATVAVGLLIALGAPGTTRASVAPPSAGDGKLGVVPFFP